MQFISLGIFSTIFNWIFEKILAPVFKVISDVLSAVLGWIFKEILAPLLKTVLWPIIESTIDLILAIFAEIIYTLMASFLSLVDMLETGFDVFIGLKPVTSRKYGDGTLLEVLFRMESVKTAFWLIMVIGLGIALVLTIFATARSAFDLDFENKRPVSKVLTSFMKTFLHFFTIPFLVFFLIQLSGIILIGVNTALTGNENVTLGNMIFVASSLDAAKSENYNISGSNQVSNIGINDDVRKPFYTGKKSYRDTEQVKENFKFEKFDFLVGFGMGIFLLIVMACSLVVFVQRLFDMIVLYLASPLFVSVMPLDDGEKFGKWREMFLGKCFSGFGTVIAMKLYMMMCPVIMGSDIVFAEKSSAEATYLMKMIFILGGAFAVLKSGSSITSLISASSGSAEQQTTDMVSIPMTGFIGSGAGKIGAGLVGVAGKLGDKRKESPQEFEESRNDAAGSSGIPGLSKNEQMKMAGSSAAAPPEKPS